MAKRTLPAPIARKIDRAAGVAAAAGGRKPKGGGTASQPDVGGRAGPKKILMRQSAVAPRAEPSTRGANHWTSGRSTKRKYH